MSFQTHPAPVSSRIWNAYPAKSSTSRIWKS